MQHISTLQNAPNLTSQYSEFEDGTIVVIGGSKIHLGNFSKYHAFWRKERFKIILGEFSEHVDVCGKVRSVS